MRLQQRTVRTAFGLRVLRNRESEETRGKTLSGSATDAEASAGKGVWRGIGTGGRPLPHPPSESTQRFPRLARPQIIFLKRPTRQLRGITKTTTAMYLGNLTGNWEMFEEGREAGTSWVESPLEIGGFCRLPLPPAAHDEQHHSHDADLAHNALLVVLILVFTVRSVRQRCQDDLGLRRRSSSRTGRARLRPLHPSFRRLDRTSSCVRRLAQHGVRPPLLRTSLAR